MTKLLFTGDIMLNNHWSKKENNPFSDEVVSYIREHDIVSVNLETLPKGNDGENLLKNPRIYTSMEALQHVSQLKPKVVNLGNNHAYDQLFDGVVKADSFINDIGAISLGVEGPGLSSDHYKSFVHNGINFHFFSYVDQNTNPNLPPDARIKLADATMENVEKDLASLKRKGNDFVIVSFHWGFDNYRLPAPYQRKLGRKAIDLGADLVWGHHSHVIQPYDSYKNKIIIYCQGNTCGDKVYSFKDFGKLQNESFLFSVELQSGATNYKIEFRELERSKSDVPTVFRKKNRAIRAFRGPENNLFVYTMFYSFYNLRYRFAYLWNYFFGYGRNPFSQLSKIPGKLLRNV